MENKYNQLYENLKDKKVVVKKNNKSNLIAYSVIASLFIGTSIGGYFLWNSQNSDSKIDKVEKIAKKTDDVVSRDVTSVDLSYIQLSLDDWMKKSYLNQTSEDKKKMLEYSKENFIGLNSEIYPSEEDGFTSDPSKEYDEDGLPNPNYVTLTYEELLTQLSQIVYRVSNPLFGDWGHYQSPSDRNLKEEISIKLLDGISTGDFSDKVYNEGNRDIFLLDYDNNNYSGRFQNDGKLKFVGVVREGEIYFNEDDTITVDMIVDYKISDSQIYKTKKITLNLIIENKKILINGGSSSE